MRIATHRWALAGWAIGVRPFWSRVNLGVQFNLGRSARCVVLWWT